MIKRYEEQGHARYLTFSCYRRKHLFRHAALADLFTQQLGEWRDKQNIELFAYVIMPNHVHLLVYPQDGKVGTPLADLKQTTGFYAQRWLKQHMPAMYEELAAVDHGAPIHRFWQAGGGYDRNVFSEDAVLRGIEYIHNNPVRSGIVQLPEDYKWSSARFWLKDEPEPIAVDVPEWWQEGHETRG